METTPIRILLVEDNPGDARLIQEMLAETEDSSFKIEWVSQLSQGLERLTQGNIDLVILDLGLPDSQGLETFIQAYEYGANLPFIVLTGQNDETVGLAALRRGAQDYLIKGKVDGQFLARAIRYAMERRRSQEALRAERMRLFSLLEALPTIIYVRDPDYYIHFANRRFEDLFGSWEGKRCYETIHGRTAVCGDCKSAKVLETRKARMWEVTCPEDNRTYQTYHYPFVDVDGAPLFLATGIDITERKQAEKELQRQREELQMILDSVPAMIFYKDKNDRFIKVNKALAEVTGLAVEEIEGKTEAEIYQEQDYWQDDLEVITSGYPKRNIIKSVQTARGKRWVQTDKIPYRGEKADFTGIIGFALDITERRQAEEALITSERGFRQLYNSMRDAFAAIDNAGKIISCNSMFKELLGYEAEELVGLTYRDITPAQWHDMEEHILRDQVQQRDFSDVYEKEYRRKDGTIVPVELRTFQIRDDDGQPAGMWAIIRDITKRKQAEAALKEQEDQLAKIYENAPLIMVLVDRERRVRKMNKLAEQFAGREASGLIGKYGGEALGCLHALDDPEGCGFGEHCQQCTVRCTVLDTFATGRSHHQVEACLPFTIDGKAQEVTFLLCTAHLSVQGQPQVLVTIQDISERKRMEEEQKDSEQKLRFLTTRLLTAQEDERKRLSQELHDELGHALLTMKLDLGVLGKQLLPEQIGLSENVNELTSYVDDVLENVRRLYLGLIPGDLEDLGLTAALKNLCEEFGRHQEKIHWSVHLENFDGLLPISVQTAIYRIFQEILTNIGKHAYPTQVSVLAKRSDNRAIFVVEDNGRGFDMERGWQSSPKAGMGLLALEERIRMLGGNLQVWSRESQGTRITFEIPLET
jgi:PAS domain S-box-containing protein